MVVYFAYPTMPPATPPDTEPALEQLENEADCEALLPA